MMFILLQQLLGVITVEQARANLISIATGLGFAATSWQEGSWQLTLIEIFAEVWAAASIGVSQIAAGGYNDLAEGPWLHLFSDSHYDNQVHLAVATQGTVTLTCDAIAGPYPIVAGETVVGTEGDITFRSITGGTLVSGGTLPITVEAEVAGSAGNVPVGAIGKLVTPLAGVTVSNPALPASTTWITRDGADVETDPELRTRNRTKWATLGIGPGMAYVYYARAAHPSVKRVFVDDTNPRGPGTADIWLAGDSGQVSVPVVTAVEDYMRGNTDGIVRINTCADLEWNTAVALNLTMNAGVYVLKSYDNAATRSKVESAILQYFKDLRIGGLPLTEGGQGAVRLNAIAGEVMKVRGLQNIAFTSPSADVLMLKYQVAVPTLNLNWYQV